MTEPTRIPDVMIERYLSDDLKPEQKARIEAAAKAVPAIAARIREIEESRAAFLLASSADALAHRIATRMTVEAKPRPRWQTWWMLPPVGVAAALLFGVVYQRALGPQSMTSAPVVVADDQYALNEAAKAEPIAVEPAPMPAPPPPPMPTVATGPAPKETMRARESATKPQRWEAERRQSAPADGAAIDRADDAKLDRKVEVVEKSLAKKDSARDEDNAIGAMGAGKGAARGYAQPPPRPEPKPAESKSANKGPSADIFEGAPTGGAAEAPAKAEYDKAKAAPAKPAPPPPATAPATPPPAAAPAKPSQAPAAFEAEDARASASSTPAEPVAQVGLVLSHRVGGAWQPVPQKAVIATGAALEARTNAQRGTLTVVGVRPDGKAHVYGQVALTSSGGRISLVPRPSPTRVHEAIFILVHDQPLDTNALVGPDRDAQRLPLRLQASGSQRRVVITAGAQPE